MFDILLRYIHTSVFGFVMPLIYCILILERYCVSVVYSYILHSPSEFLMVKTFQPYMYIHPTQAMCNSGNIVSNCQVTQN